LKKEPKRRESIEKHKCIERREIEHRKYGKSKPKKLAKS